MAIMQICNAVCCGFQGNALPAVRLLYAGVTQPTLGGGPNLTKRALATPARRCLLHPARDARERESESEVPGPLWMSATLRKHCGQTTLRAETRAPILIGTSSQCQPS